MSATAVFNYSFFAKLLFIIASDCFVAYSDYIIYKKNKQSVMAHIVKNKCNSLHLLRFAA